jgi:methylated-DNA-[protein]-cysteine S-methyltransferase
MPLPGFTLFESPVGRCGIAWGERGIVALQLPEASEAQTRDRLRRRFLGTVEAPPPPEVQRTIDGVLALLRGEASDLSAVALDMEGVPPFDRSVYEVARTVPPGETVTYGEIADRLGGGPETARRVGQALGRNPFPIVVPCHRVLASGGRIGGFSADGGAVTKRRLLALEGARGVQSSLFDG